MDPKKAVPIWEKYIEFESQHGDLKALTQAELRREKNLGFSGAVPVHAVFPPPTHPCMYSAMPDINV